MNDDEPDTREQMFSELEQLNAGFSGKLDELKRTKAAAGSKDQSPSAPEKLIDERLVGSWHWSTFMSSGGFSASVHNYRVLGSDGTFVQGGKSFADSALKDASGNWAGLNSLTSGAAPKDRGWWEIVAGRLVLHFDNDTYADYEYVIRDSSLFLTPEGGERKLWTKA